MRKLTIVLALAALAACAKKAAPEATVKGITKFQLGGGAAISQPDVDDYNPQVLQQGDNFLVLVFASNRSCGTCTGHNLFIARSTTAYNNDAVFPSFENPTVMTVAGTPLNFANAIAFTPVLSGNNVRIYLTNAGGTIQQTTAMTPGGSYDTTLSAITNTTGATNATVVGSEFTGSKLYARQNGTLYSFTQATTDTPVAIATGQTATSLASVDGAFTSRYDAFFSLVDGTIAAMSLYGNGGNLVSVNTAIAKARLSARYVSVMRGGGYKGGLMFISGIESGGTTQDMYVVDGMTVWQMWQLINPKPPGAPDGGSIPVETTVANPAFSPVSGTYSTLLNLTITSTTVGATICYTSNGTDPECDATPTCTTGTQYSTAVGLGYFTGTAKAIACKSGLTNSAIVSAAYVSDIAQPTVASITSSTANGSYTTGQNISIQVIFNEVVNVSGTPQLTLATGTPATTPINYVSGSGTTTLTFTYVVAAGNTSADLNYSSTLALSLNGGTIRDIATNNAILTLPALASGSALAGNKAIVIDTTVPVISSVAPTTGPYTSTLVSYTLSEAIASGSVTFTRTGGTVDAGSPHTKAFVGAELNTGAHSNITLTNNPTLVSGTTYDVAFNCTDAAGNAGATVTNTGVTYNAATGNTGTEAWARSVSAGASTSEFKAVTVDSSGNVYAAGYQSGTGTYTYGSQSVTGPSAGTNVVLVKYDASGNALWARSVSPGPSVSMFYSVAVDSSGNIYAAGYQNGTGTYTYGSQSVAGTYAGANIVLVKYDTSGTALWARSVSAGAGTSTFNAVTVDSSGNIYAAGNQNGTGTFTYGSQSVTGTYTVGNVLLVKYNTSGTALWARSVNAGTNYSVFYSVAVDSAGNIYAAGYQNNTTTFTYGSQSVTGTGSANVLLVKYDASGTALWARSISAGILSSYFYSVAVDSSDNIYAAGTQGGSGTYTYGSQSVAGTYAGQNTVLVKYDSSGTALWARSVSAGAGHSYFYGVAADSLGNIYAGGSQNGTGTYTYNGQSVAGTYAGGTNVVLVKYNGSGNALWVRSVSAGTNNSIFNSVTADSSNNVYTAGYQNNSAAYTYGSQSVAGTYASGSNVVLLKYQ